jgi:hypothetical protein
MEYYLVYIAMAVSTLVVMEAAKLSYDMHRDLDRMHRQEHEPVVFNVTIYNCGNDGPILEEAEVVTILSRALREQELDGVAHVLGELVSPQGADEMV